MAMFNNLFTKFLKIIPVGSRRPIGARCSTRLTVVSRQRLYHPIRSFEVGMALPSCPTLGQGPVYFSMNQSLDAGEPWLRVFFG